MKSWFLLHPQSSRSRNWLPSTKPAIETHHLGIGMNEKDPARLVFEGKEGDAIVVSLIDMGGRLRLIVHSLGMKKYMMGRIKMVFLTAVQSDVGWGEALLSLIDVILSITGGISLFLCVVRFFHNRKMVSWTDSAIIKDFNAEYDYEMEEKSPIYAKISRPNEYTSLVMFKPVNCVIRKLEIIRLRQNGKVKRIVETYHNLTPETPVFFHVERAECITRYKLKWYLDFGDYCEYELVENGRNGINDSEGAVYHSTWISNLRKAFGFV